MPMEQIVKTTGQYNLKISGTHHNICLFFSSKALTLHRDFPGDSDNKESVRNSGESESEVTQSCLTL